MGRAMLLVAVGCGRLPGMLEVAARQPFVVLGTMQEGALASLHDAAGGEGRSALPVYFYETG